MMNMTVDEERQLNPKPKVVNVRRAYYKPKFLCDEKHELAMLYSRMTSTTAIKRIIEYFWCPVCKKIYQPSVGEAETKCMN